MRYSQGSPPVTPSSRQSNREHACTRTTSSAGFEDEYSGDCLLKNLNVVVLQYLENRGLEASYSTFCRECNMRGVPLPKELPPPSFPSINFTTSDGEQLLNNFDDEEGKEMLEMWTQFLGEMEPSEKDTINTITFYLQIYMATIPYRQNKSHEEKERGMIELRDFFQQKSNECTTDDNMLSLFALPYVPDPMNHPIFKNIFQDPWRDKIRSLVTNVIRHHFQSRSNNLNIDSCSCELTQMFLKWKQEESNCDSDDNLPPSVSKTFFNKCNQTDESQCNEDKIHNADMINKFKNSDLETKAQFRKQNAEIESLKKNILTYEDRYYKLLRVTGEVVGSLEQAVQGKAQDIEELIHRLQLVFPELFPSALIVQEMERQTNAKAGANADRSSSQEVNSHQCDLEEQHDAKEPRGQAICHSSRNDTSENLLCTKANQNGRQELQAPDFNFGKLSSNPKRKIGGDENQITSEQKFIHEPEDTTKTTCSKARSKKGGMPVTKSNCALQPEEEIPRKSRNTTIEFEKHGTPLLQMLTSSPNEHEPAASSRKNNTNAPKTKRTKSPHNRKSVNAKQQHSEQSVENSHLSQTNSKGGPRRFLQTQPQFAVRSESHPLNNYQHPTEPSVDSWQNNVMPAPILDPRRKADALTSAKSRAILSPRSTERHIPKAPSSKINVQSQGTPKNLEVSKTVLQKKSTAGQSRRICTESLVDHTSQSSVTTAAPVPVARQRRSKQNLSTKNSVPEPAVELPPSRRQVIDSKKSGHDSHDQRPIIQSFQNVPSGQGRKEEGTRTIISRNPGNDKTNKREAFTPATKSQIIFRDLERRCQWFSRSDSDVRTDGSSREPKPLHSSRKHQSFVVHSP